jgi:hypothetical protein
VKGSRVNDCTAIRAISRDALALLLNDAVLEILRTVGQLLTRCVKSQRHYLEGDNIGRLVDQGRLIFDVRRSHALTHHHSR